MEIGKRRRTRRARSGLVFLVLGFLVVLTTLVPATAHASAGHRAGAPPAVQQDLEQMVADGEPGVAAQLDDIAGGWATPRASSPRWCCSSWTRGGCD